MYENVLPVSVMEGVSRPYFVPDLNHTVEFGSFGDIIIIIPNCTFPNTGGVSSHILHRKLEGQGHKWVKHRLWFGRSLVRIPRPPGYPGWAIKQDP